MKLQIHDRPISEFTEIDKFILISKKFWEDFEAGEIRIKINGQKIKTWVYDVRCNCNPTKHTHRILDLRGVWKKLQLKAGEKVELEL